MWARRRLGHSRMRLEDPWVRVGQRCTWRVAKIPAPTSVLHPCRALQSHGRAMASVHHPLRHTRRPSARRGSAASFFYMVLVILCIVFQDDCATTGLQGHRRGDRWDGGQLAGGGRRARRPAESERETEDGGLRAAVQLNHSGTRTRTPCWRPPRPRAEAAREGEGLDYNIPKPEPTCLSKTSS